MIDDIIVALTALICPQFVISSFESENLERSRTENGLIVLFTMGHTISFSRTLGTVLSFSELGLHFIANCLVQQNVISPHFP